MMSEGPKASVPGEAALRNMQLLKQESSVFKVPKIPKKRIAKRVQVLDEDEYVQGIAKIIQRDFFPDLEKLKAQNDFLEATENKDYARLREIYRKYSSARAPPEPFNSPPTFDTPRSSRPHTPGCPADTPGCPSATPGCPATSRPDTADDLTDKHSLDSFLARHTSEDNASYERLRALEARRGAAALAAAAAAEAGAAQRAAAALALPSLEQQADQTRRPDELDTWRYRARNFIMYVPEGAAGEGGEGGEGGAPRATLLHRNTRLRAPPFDPGRDRDRISAIAGAQGASVAGKIGVDGSSAGPAGAAGAAGGLVAAASPAPGAGPDASPLMTWGQIEGTPFRLDGGDTPLPAAGAGAAYRMLAGGAREALALRLAERARRPPPSPSPSPSPSPGAARSRTRTERLAGMSPAARRLAARHLLSPRAAPAPTPARPPPAPRPLVAAPRTPRSPRTPRTPRSPPPAAARPADTLTDDLLQLSVARRARLKAQDFFS